MIADQGVAGRWIKGAVDFAIIVPESLQFILNIGYDFVGWETVITVDRAIIDIVGVVRIIAPARVPPTTPPAPPTEIDEDDGIAMMVPPILTVIIMAPLAVILLRLGKARWVCARVVQSVLCLLVEVIARIVSRPVSRPSVSRLSADVPAIRKPDARASAGGI